MTSELADILSHVATFAPDLDAEPFFAALPSKWCVALLLDRTGAPLQLVCAKNLRAMARRRLASPDGDEVARGPSKRVNYRSLVGGIAWQRVDGDFEMDLVYIEAARRAFPAHWRQLVPDRAGHFVSIDLAQPHPDFVRSSDVRACGQAFGPFPDKSKADRWVDLAREAFDLCRYRNILAQAPNGRACAYKQMSKCPAPCDGSVPLDSYRANVAAAVVTIRSPAPAAAAFEAEMRALAAMQEFERAGRVKARLATFNGLHEGTFKNVRPIDEFRYLAVQPGPRWGTAKLFLLTAAAIAEVAAVLDASASFEDVTRVLDACDPERSRWPAEVTLGTISYHMTSPKSAARIVARRDLDAAVLAALLAEASKPAKADATAEAVRETRLPP